MRQFWSQERRNVWKDVSSIFTPAFVAAMTVLVGWWVQSVTNDRSVDQTRLQLAISILQSGPKDDPMDGRLRDWALKEFTKQTDQPFGVELVPALRDRPDIFRKFDNSSSPVDLESLKNQLNSGSRLPPADMPTMAVPETFNDPLPTPKR